MSKSKHTTAVCSAIVALALVLTILFMNGEALGIAVAPQETGYQSKIFDTSYVHTIDIVMNQSDWDSFLDTAENEEYVLCSLVIDGEKVKNVGIRAKGNTSLSNVAGYGNDRYSFKVEFDQYDSSKSYYGLDKLTLNNNIQDNTLMKDYLTYRMMAEMGVNAPLVSYAWVTINGEDWGLYLALEAVEDSFLERNYGGETGDLYKPDSMSMGGGRGNGQDFNMEDFAQQAGMELPEGIELPQGMTPPSQAGGQGNEDSAQRPEMPNGSFADNGGFGGGNGGMGGGFGGSMGSSDVSLIYSDDDPESYSNIFDNAKTTVTSADQLRLIAALKRLNANEEIENTVSVEQVIRYFVVHNFVVNFDSYTGSMIHNYYLYEEDGVLSMIPWDYNLAFGGFVGGSDATELVNYPIDTPVSGGDVSSRPMLSWIFESEEYTALYHQYFAEFMADFFDSGRFEALFDETVALISPYVQRDKNGFCTYEEFLLGTATLREFCLRRAQSVSGQLAGTIPATSDGQSADSSALIDASDLSISDMGGMGGGMGGDRGNRGQQTDFFGNAGTEPSSQSSATGDPPTGAPSDTGTPPEGASPGDAPSAAETPAA